MRQLRLRDIGGIIVIDFIDMVLEANRDLVLRRLVECLGRDRTKHQVAEVTSLGLVQMTRKRIGTDLLEAFSEPCEICKGRGDHPPRTGGPRPRQAGVRERGSRRRSSELLCRGGAHRAERTGDACSRRRARDAGRTCGRHVRRRTGRGGDADRRRSSAGVAEAGSADVAQPVADTPPAESAEGAATDGPLHAVVPDGEHSVRQAKSTPAEQVEQPADLAHRA